MDRVPYKVAWRASLTAMLGFSIVACKPMDPAQVPGTYVAEYAQGRDELVVRPDGTYEHVLSSRGVRVVDSGKWIFETLDGEKLGLSFYDFRFRTHDGSIKPKGIWHVEVEPDHRSDKYKLCFDPDLYSCFLQQGT